MNETKHRFPYKWTLKEANFTKDKGTVFSCFSCGGGSTMGYKLAGFDVIGCNEIDPKMMAAYIENHKPKYSFLEPIQTFKLREDLPKELYNLDILDGSPPCSSFSMAGNREKDWGKEKKFREGQAMQVLDNLFFDFIGLTEKLQPKVVIAENVKGILLGEARTYARKIMAEFDKAGYYTQYFLLDASKMGVPQKRERVFFIGLRKDLASPFMKQMDMFTENPELVLDFNEPEITYGDIKTELGRTASILYQERWKDRIDSDFNFGDILERTQGKGSSFSDVFAKDNLPLPTLTAKGGVFDWNTCNYISEQTFIKANTFPEDYSFCNNKPHYITGMSVPPIMAAQIATEIYSQWLSKL